MKLINKLDETNERSLYSGRSNANVEMYLRPMPKVDSDGNPIKQTKRYYVFRMLYFQSSDRSYPFIVRNEHQYFRKDASGKILEVKRICCPTTLWAKSKINEAVGKDYCPICKMSFDQNTEAWKNFKSTKQIDNACLQISNDTKKVWAAYIPVLVVNDPSYDKNNNHFRVLRLSGVEGQSTFNRIRSLITEANEKGISVFNGDEGANIAILCEKQRKLAVKKDGSPIIDSRTGEQKSYEANVVTDVRLLSNRLHAYPQVTEEELSKLQFDETYGIAATRDQLNVFLHENYLDTGASDADFGDDFGDTGSSVEDDDFGEPVAVKSNIEQKTKVKVDVSDDVFTEDDIESGVNDENPMDMISRITNKKPSSTTVVSMQSKVELPPDTEELRNNSMSFNEDDLPF